VAQLLRGNIDFLADTGADITTIMPDDRDRIGIARYAVVQGCPPTMLGIGGGTPIFYLHDVTLLFCGVDETTHETIALPRIGVLWPPHASRRFYKGAPSLLGRDLLCRGRLEISEVGVFFDVDQADEASRRPSEDTPPLLTAS